MLIELKDLQEKIEAANTDDMYVDIVRKYLFHGTPFVYNNRENDYYDFRAIIANHWGVKFHEVLILGSAKLGYSYYKKTRFSLDSDIDVAIVNPSLFEKYVLIICRLQYDIERGIITMTNEEKRDYNLFLKYMVKGWMRPDHLPTKFKGYFNKDHWFDFFRSISHGKSNVGNFEVSCGLFKNFDYMEQYYVESLKSVK